MVATVLLPCPISASSFVPCNYTWMIGYFLCAATCLAFLTDSLRVMGWVLSKETLLLRSLTWDPDDLGKECIAPVGRGLSVAQSLHRYYAVPHFLPVPSYWRYYYFRDSPMPFVPSHNEGRRAVAGVLAVSFVLGPTFWFIGPLYPKIGKSWH